MFEQRTEAEMRLYSEKTARELALQRLKKESDVPEDGDATEDGALRDTPASADEAQLATDTTVTRNPKGAE
ncbi:hypothetical protein ABZT06_45280 [Streptomyces sp. NPDC005483]|uniref:hypothetical protein n=1 Tax=Streptomyces sp. NPDC005483 TaxID=3154882 RepID=UPI00339F45D6